MKIFRAETRQGDSIVGEGHGASVSLILDDSGPGDGPRLHRHPYDETWVVTEGRLTFQLGDDRQQVRPGDVVFAPLGAPHKFTNNGPRRSRMVCIHASPKFITEWLE